MREETRKIISCDDFELGIKRETLLEYTVSYPSNKMIKAIVFIIPGFGNDANSRYMETLRKFAVEEYSVAVVNVMYHCFYSRLNNGATLAFDDIDIMVLKEMIKKYNIDFSYVQEITTESVLDRLEQEDIDITIPMTLIPKNNEYQNFGIIQAIDHLSVLKDLRKNVFSLDSQPKVICVGSSHGGYIANLIAKIAPGVIDYVIDNSAYTSAPMSYILGKETNINHPEFVVYNKKLVINCFVQTYWTGATSSPFYLSEDRLEIRNIGNFEHLKHTAEVSKSKTKYIYYHSSKDTLAPAEDKVILSERLKELGFSVALHVMNESDIDGKFIKNLDHGMGMSMKELIKRELPNILKQNKVDFKTLGKVEYKGLKIAYSFDFEKEEYTNF